MSGYRSIHREKVIDMAIWSVEATDLLLTSSSKPVVPTTTTELSWRIWAACADGLVRSYVVMEASIDSKKDSLDASALKLICTHELGEKSLLGCTRVSCERNYVGSDDRAGDLIVASLELAGKVRIWKLSEDMDQGKQHDGLNTMKMKPLAEFQVENATGSTFKICPPRSSGVGDVTLTVGLLDGTIAIVATGLVTPKSTKAASTAGTILDSWGSSGSSVPLSLAWHPKESLCLAVGRQDGIIDILSSSRKNQHRLTQHKSAVRALSYTGDGQLLIAGADDGFLTVFDVGRKVPTMVHHVLQAHKSWIMDVTAFQDSRRFATIGAERQIHVWTVDQMYQPFHTFQTEQSIWSVQRGPRDVPRIVTGSDTGSLQIYSLAN